MGFFQDLKQKWQIKSNLDFFLINVVFALAGMTIVYERKPLFHLIGITENTAFWIKVLVYIPFIIPVYQINLLIYGLLLGQFSFFWEKEKRLGRFLVKVVSGKKN